VCLGTEEVIEPTVRLSRVLRTVTMGSAIALVLSFLFPVAFPDVQSARFFSTTLVEARKPFHFIGPYIRRTPSTRSRTTSFPRSSSLAVVPDRGFGSVRDSEKSS